jgi:hypothetical protein
MLFQVHMVTCLEIRPFTHTLSLKGCAYLTVCSLIRDYKMSESINILTAFPISSNCSVSLACLLMRTAANALSLALEVRFICRRDDDVVLFSCIPYDSTMIVVRSTRSHD